jgi:signal transduction histidine kinase
MLVEGPGADEIAAVRGGLALLRQVLTADRTAVYLVKGTSTNGDLGFELVASEPLAVGVGRVPVPISVSRAFDHVSYVPDVAREIDTGTDARTYFGVPLLSEGRTVGLVEMISTRVDAFSEADRQAAVAFASILGSLLDSAGRRESRDTFLVLAAHELRTPLTTAAGFAQTIAEHFEQLDPIVIRDLLARILRNHRRLDRLVDDLVDLSSIEGRHLQVSPVPVVVGSLLEEVVHAADSGSHPISCDLAADLPMVWADPDRLEQVVTNLLANAAKFSPEGAPIRISARLQDGSVVIAVSDRGPGISPELQDRIFDAYYQGEAVSGGRPRGLGIGLYLTRFLCGLMGGTVTVESQPGGGSTFIVTLPTAPPDLQPLDTQS